MRERVPFPNEVTERASRPYALPPFVRELSPVSPFEIRDVGVAVASVHAARDADRSRKTCRKLDLEPFGPAVLTITNPHSRRGGTNPQSEPGSLLRGGGGSQEGRHTRSRDLLWACHPCGGLKDNM